MSETFLFQCPECQSTMKLPTSLAGRQGKCPDCEKVFLVEPGAATSSNSAPTKEPDFADQDVTFQGERNSPPQVEQSLGDHVTRGDATTSSPDKFKQILDDGDFGEIVDLETRYQAPEQLGAGGQGKVLKMTDKRLGRTVALKFLLAEFADSPQALARFMTEAKAIATLNHQNIVQIFDMERSAEGPYLVMEFVGGGSLLDRLEEGTMDVADAVSITCQLCDALTLAHQKGIIHRDIKPANILLTEEGIPKLTDFGLARQGTADHGQTAVGAILGTIDFMSPEQRVDATSVDARSDLWSLAATFYQMVTGSSPRVIDLEEVPQQLRSVISRALKREPDARFQDGDSFRDALQEALASPDGIQPEPVIGAEEEKNNAMGIWDGVVAAAKKFATPAASSTTDKIDDADKDSNEETADTNPGTITEEDSPENTAVTGAAHVVIERQEAMDVGAWTLKVSEAGMELASIKNGKSGSFDLPPGNHTFQFKIRMIPALSETFQVVDGNTLTLRVATIKGRLGWDKLVVEQIN